MLVKSQENNIFILVSVPDDPSHPPVAAEITFGQECAAALSSVTSQWDLRDPTIK
jgi:hypothetical protein